MTRATSAKAPSPAGRDVVVTVVRGSTNRVERVFELGQGAQPLAVGSQADWRVSGPGIMPQHFYLSFDGQRVHAASAGAPVYSNDQPLPSGWHALEDGTELRFGFGLLRIGRAALPAPAGVPHRARTKRLASGLAAAAALISSLALAGFISNRHSTSRSNASAASSAVASARSSSKQAQPAPLAEPTPAPPSAPPERPLAADISRAPQAPLPKAPAAYPQNVANRPVPRIGDKPWLIAPEWRTRHERQLHAAGRESAQLVFLGDSITEGWGAVPAFREHFGKYSPLNLGIAGDMTQNVLWRVEHGALDGTQPKLVVLLIGINNLGGGFSAEDTAAGVRATVAAVRAHVPATRVLLLAILPARQDPENPLRQRIQEANRLLQGFAEPGHIDFHDLGSVLLETDGRISNATMRDFLHPTAQGFERLSGALDPLLTALLAPPSE